MDSSESDITKKIDSDVLRTDDFPSTFDDSGEDTARRPHTDEVKNFQGSEFDISSTHAKHVSHGTGSSESDVTKKIDADVLSTEEFPALGTEAPSTKGKYQVKTADEEVEDALNAGRGKTGEVKGKADEATDKAARKANETKDALKDTAKEAAENVGDAKESVKGNVVDAKDTVKSTAGDIKGEADKAASAHQPKVEEAKQEAGQKWDHTKNKAGEFTSAVQDSAGAAGHVAKEKAEQVKDTVGNALGATKEKANEAGENVKDKTAEAAEAASARADAAHARGEYTADSEWARTSDEALGKATNDDVYPKAEETKEDAKRLLGGFANILGEASMAIQDTVNAPGERISDQ